MGNIHGSCINVDVLTRDGSTYFGKPRPDFLTANDAWFMPVVQKTGPDGCLYILDWYDRYHCYQDANRDPERHRPRLKGRLYRVRYKDTPRAGLFDLAKETDDKLIERLHSPNVYFRDLAQRLLTERGDQPEPRKKLETSGAGRDGAAQGPDARPLGADRQRRRSTASSICNCWKTRTRASVPGPCGLRETTARAIEPSSARSRPWPVTPVPDVQLQVVIAPARLGDASAFGVLLDVLAHCGDDKVIPAIVWQNLHPLLEKNAAVFVGHLDRAELKSNRNLAALLPRVIERLLANKQPDCAAVCGLL